MGIAGSCRKTFGVSAKNDSDRVAPLAQMPRHDKGIAAVVSRPGKYRDRVGHAGNEQSGLIGCGGTGQFH